MQNYRLTLRHFPTLFLLAGYPLYWLELGPLNQQNGCTSILGWGIIFVIFVYLFIKTPGIKNIQSFLVQPKSAFEQIFLFVSLAFIFVILGIALYASLLPPHLVQEFDALNYHITLPRQHLLWQSFAHIPWSSGDLFLLPVDFALAPFWLATQLPNKFPQYFFAIGLVAIVLNLVRTLILYNSKQVAFAAGVSILSLHFFGIQLGTAMMDIVLCYLFFACIDSVMEGKMFYAAVEAAFFFWSKPFLPFQMTAIAGVGIVFWLILKKSGFRMTLKLPGIQPHSRRRFVLYFSLLSVLIAGPFMLKSWYYAGTPVYPFFPNAQESILNEASVVHMESKDDYGHGRSVVDFVKHLWLLAVPEKGPNNVFDYPVGLTFLLYLGPFLYLIFHDFFHRRFNPITLFIILYWGSWWFGSQQSRFLYIPIILMIIVVLMECGDMTKVFKTALILALALTAVSVFRAHRKDFVVQNRIKFLREKDKNIVMINKQFLIREKRGVVLTEDFDMAFAQFPVVVIKQNLPWSLGTNF